MLTETALSAYISTQLLRIAPRLTTHPRIAQPRLSGHWKDVWGLDSMELMELAAFFHAQFQMLQGSVENYLLQYHQPEEWLAALGRCVQDEQLPLVFQTSGSTGLPKACSHTKARLRQEVDFLATLMPGARRVWRLVPPHHIYGFLFTVLLPDHLGLPVEDARTQAWPRLLQALQPGDVVVGHPLWWQNWAQQGLPWPAGCLGINSTGPLAPAAEAYLAGQPGRFILVYGSSETSGIGFRHPGEAAYTLFPYLRPGEEGLILTQPDGVEQEIPLMDHLQWQDARHFVLSGRKDQAVQVGGYNVFPAQIARRLAQRPGVRQAWVRPMLPEEGNRLKAWVVPEPGTEVESLRADLFAWIEANLTVPERPRDLIVADQPPLDGVGKVREWSLSTQ